ncbi:MAG: 2-oxo acid dehydrogenase subunit E2 [Abditibacteriota bacterium]|nr:2-oxo acid dehydrogenase subunit E2 [Abditibacteriota bacterium]
MSVAAKKASAKEGVNPVLMPRQGQSVESCVITSWAKKVGDPVKVGDVIFSYETDKSSFDEESKYEGVMQGIFFEEGDDVPCLTVVCCIGKAGIDVSDFDPKGASAPAAAPAPTVAPAAAPVQAVASSAPQTVGDRLKISPRAKHLAEKMGIDPTLAGATGPYGRIIEKDINTLADNYSEISAKAQASATPDLKTIPVEAKVPTATGADFKDEPLSNIRKTISKAMTASLTEMAQLTLNSSFDATAVMDLRKKIKAATAMGVGNITVTDIILYAVSRTLMKHPYVNANLIDGKTMRFFNVANVGLAVDTPRGLLVPTIFHADTMTLSQISEKAKEGADKCKEGKISPDELKGASFTVSNLGTFGVESFTPVINPPQTCILGVNTIQQKIKIVDGEVKPYPAMGLSLTFDHRALDGAPAARFLKDLVFNLENIEVLLAL